DAVEVGQAYAVNVLDGLDVPAARGPAPAEGDARRPVHGGRRARKQGLDALEQRLTPLDQLLEVGHPAVLGSVIGVDGNVFVGQVAGPHARRGLAPSEHDATRNLALLHRALPVPLAVAGGAPAPRRYLHVVEIQLDAVDVEIAHSGVADSGEQPPQ